MSRWTGLTPRISNGATTDLHLALSSPVCAVRAEDLALGNEERRAYLAHNSGGLEVQTAWCQSPVRLPLAVSRHVEEQKRHTHGVASL